MADKVGRPGLWKRRLKVTLLIFAGLLALPVVIGMVSALIDPATWNGTRPPSGAAGKPGQAVRIAPRDRPAKFRCEAPPEHGISMTDQIVMKIDYSALPVLNVELVNPKEWRNRFSDSLFMPASKLMDFINELESGDCLGAKTLNVVISPGPTSPHLMHTTFDVAEAIRYYHQVGTPAGLFDIGRGTGFYGSSDNELAAARYCVMYKKSRMCDAI